jgi:2-polyprenyl-6-methoxyphenol hydroxylase-like FAD-dependent oxidoreductase
VALPVLVAGAGPVGLTLACELQRLGVEHRLVDAAPARAAVSRATDLHARSLEVWDAIGAADEIVAAGLAIASVPLLSGGREVARIDFTGVGSAFPAAVSLRQHDLEDLLEARLARPPERGLAVEVAWQEDDSVVARVGGAQVRASFVVACDGVHSSLREAAGIPYEGGEYPGLWAAMDVDVEGWPYRDDEIPVFLDADGFWAMPLPGGRVRLFFRDDAAGPQPEIPDAQAVIDRHVPGGARVRAAPDRGCFRLHHRVARRYRAGRLLLAGDAAHAMSPVSGQGLNTGVQDAANLAWKLRLALEGAPPLVLDSYEAERRPVALAAIAASTATQDANLLTGPEAAARDLALAAAFATPAGSVAAAEAGHELAVAYPESPIIGGEPPPGGPGVAPGGRIPDAGPLVRQDGSATGLRELLREPRMQLWVCAGAGALAPSLGLAARFAPALRARVIVPGEAPPPAPPGVEALADATLAVHGRLGAVREAAFVVRPDGYLGFRAEPPDADRIAGHLGRLGVTGPATRGSG